MGIIVGELFITDSGIIEAGTYIAGAVLGKVTDTGVLKLSAKKDNAGNDITDGSQNPYAILLENVTTNTNRNVPILVFGEVDESKLSFGKGWDLASIKDELKKIGIFAKGVING